MTRRFFRIDPEVELARLTPLQYRLLGHLAHLAGVDGRIETSISKMALACGLFRDTVKIGLRQLEHRNIVVTESGNGKKPIRRLNPPSVWKADPEGISPPVETPPGVKNGEGLLQNQPPKLTRRRSPELKKGQTW